MKTLRFITIGFVFAAVFAGAALAQTNLPSKVALVNTDAFYQEADGIKKIAAAYKALDLEFKTDFAELENMAKRFEVVQAEAAALQNSTTPVKPEAIQAKVDEAEKLQRDFKFKQEDAKARYGGREAKVLSPIVEDIGKAIGEFAKQKGFTLVFDSGKLFEAKVLIYLEGTTEITREFVQFYNARPAGTAAAKPQ